MIVVYYPPGKTAAYETSMIDYLTNGIDSILQSYPSAGFIIAGDFNKMKLGPLCNRFDLRKMVKKPTRENNILDQIVRNMSPLFQEIQHLRPLGRWDHQRLLLNPKCRMSTRPRTRTIKPMNRSNLIALEIKLSKTAWDAVYEAEDADDEVSIFNGVVTQALDGCLPLKTIRIHPTDKPWMTPSIKAEIKLRQRAFICRNMAQYNLMCAKVEDMIKKAKSNYYENKAKSFRTYDPAKWYKAIYDLSGVSTWQDDLTTSSVTSGAALAGKLQISFTEPWRDLNTTSIPQLDDVETLLKDYSPSLPSIGQIRYALDHPKQPAWLLKRFSSVLAPIVHDIITASIKQCKYPSCYKHGLVTPVPKVYPPVDISNDVRQVSVLPHIGKILERVQLQLNQKDITLRPSQYDFTKDRSTTSALIAITQPWFNATDSICRDTAGIHALFIDFRKAFDLIDDGILLNKLAHTNVNKNFWLWVKSFLSGRNQQVPMILFSYNRIYRDQTLSARITRGMFVASYNKNFHIQS